MKDVNFNSFKVVINKNPIMNLHYSIIRIYPNLKKVYYEGY